jgi:hypothetical protein
VRREAENLTYRLERLAGQLAIGVVEWLEWLNEGSGLADHEVFVLEPGTRLHCS